LRSFEMSGAEFMSYLRLIVNLQPDESLLDIRAFAKSGMTEMT